MSARRAATDPPEEGEDQKAPPTTFELCGHPRAHGVCWYSQIGDHCGIACKWLVPHEDVGR